jgi:hypothetical protein
MGNETERPADKPEAVVVTPWFSARQAPARDGWYETMYDPKAPGADGPGHVARMLWVNGAFWHFGPTLFLQTGVGDMPGDRWRGLRRPA